MAEPATVFEGKCNHQLTIREVLNALCRALDLSQGHSPGHCLRCCYIGTRLATEMDLCRDESEALFFTCLLKDLGCGSEGARGVLRGLERRPQQGADIALQMGFSPNVADGIFVLGEHWDGGGQPLGLKADEIPIQSRVALVAQVLDDLAEATGPEAALSELDARSGSWFDPSVVRAAHAGASKPGFWDMWSVPDLSEHLFDQGSAPERWPIDEDRLDEVVRGFARVIDAKSPFTVGHSTRVAFYTDLITERLGYSRHASRWMWRTALLHDIGKLGVSTHILEKPGSLTDDEFAEIKRHPELGREILSGIAPFAPMARIVAAHHERLDGTGYPMGLSGDQITLDMRVLTVADVFDALTADRPYRVAMPLAQVWHVLSDLSRAAVDPDVVAVLKTAVTETGNLGLD